MMATTERALLSLGNSDLLTVTKTALFCSARCPGDVILRAHDLAIHWREEGRCVISGFHSPLERDCLSILLRGSQPIIICPARGIGGMRLPREWRKAMDDGRLLILSPFAAEERRVTAELAARRNEFVASLADEVVIVHATPGGKLAALAERIEEWGKPLVRLS